MNARKRPEDEGEGLAERILAAAFAVPAFALSLYVVLYLAVGWRAGRAFVGIPFWCHAIYLAIASSVGLVFGFRGITWLLGHLFLTNRDTEKSHGTTVALWTAYALLVAVGYFAGKQ